MDERSLTNLETRLLDAAVDPAEWPGVLEDMSRWAGATGTVLLSMTARAPGLPFSEALTDLATVYFRDGWHVNDLRAAGLPLMLKTGIFGDQDFISPEAMDRTPYYQDFLRPAGLRWFAGLGFRAGSEQWCAAFQRSPRQGLFSAGEQQRLLRLQGALDRASTLAQRLGNARLEGMTDGFSAVGGACLVLDRGGRVVRLNEAAERLLAGSIQIAAGRLRTELAADSRKLEEHFRAVLWNDKEAAAGGLAPVVLRRTGKSALLAHAVELRGRSHDCFTPGCALVLLTDLGARDAAPELWLRNLFGLTPAESRLATQLVAGESLADIAEAGGLSRETLRNQLKAVFNKTETHRQGELIRLLLKIPKG
jgi:DNA-binding CsgD family transcriptional regulator/PAS domain-containing protein